MSSFVAPCLWWSIAALIFATASSPIILIIILSDGTLTSSTGAATLAALLLASIFTIILITSYIPRARFTVSRDQLVVISGCDSGLGAATALKLARDEGFTVFAGCLTAAGVKSYTNIDGVTAFLLDVTDDNAGEALVQRVSTWLSSASTRSLHALVNNAGIATSGVIDWASIDTYRDTMDVNFFGHVTITKALLPLLYSSAVAARLDATPPPRVINITSVAGLIGVPGLSAYCASKFALEAFSDALRRESASFGLAVAIIEPSFLRTPILLDIEGRARATFAALPLTTRERWGNEYAESVAKRSAEIERASEPLALGVFAIMQAVTHYSPIARYRAGTQGIFLLPYIAALPAFLSDAILKRAGGNAKPAGANITTLKKIRDLSGSSSSTGRSKRRGSMSK